MVFNTISSKPYCNRIGLGLIVITSLELIDNCHGSARQKRRKAWSFVSHSGKRSTKSARRPNTRAKNAVAKVRRSLWMVLRLGKIENKHCSSR